MLSIDNQFKRSNDAPLAWWYVHGRLEGPTLPPMEFMLTLFRVKLKKVEGSRHHGYQMIANYFDVGSGSGAHATCVDHGFISAMKSRLLANEEGGADSSLLTRLFEMVGEEGPPHPIRLADEAPMMHDNPWGFSWEYGELSIDNDSISLVLKLDDKVGNLRLSGDFDGRLFNLFDDVSGSESRYGMSYYTRPRLPVEGWLNDQHCHGQLWLDHQWGDFEWLIDRENHRKIRGWTWFGINLDTGADLILWQQHEAESREILKFFAIEIHADEIKVIPTLHTEPEGSWFSHYTDVDYPSGFRICLPERGYDLNFQPLAPDQEIPVFGPMRSVWQGAGRITGTLNGAQITGTGRCELSGYAYIHDLKNHFDRLKLRVDQQIEDFFPLNPGIDHMSNYIGDPYWTHEPVVLTKMMSEPVWDLMKRSGKRWRPILAYQMLKAFQINPEPYEQAIFALAELIHTGSLIIDDIQDASLFRRGADSIHIKYGQDLAIAAGNTLYFLPSILIMDHKYLSDGQKHAILDLFNRQLIRAHFGQTMDLFWSKNYILNGNDPANDLNLLSRLKQMYALKTGAPIQGLAEAAAIIAGNDVQIRKVSARLANDLGVSFQIIDDIKSFQSMPQTGKTESEDLKEGKITYLIAKSLSIMEPHHRIELVRILKTPELRNDAHATQRGAELVKASGAIDFCHEQALIMVKNAWTEWCREVKPTDARAESIK